MGATQRSISVVLFVVFVAHSNAMNAQEIATPSGAQGAAKSCAPLAPSVCLQCNEWNAEQNANVQTCDANNASAPPPVANNAPSMMYAEAQPTRMPCAEKRNARRSNRKVRRTNRATHRSARRSNRRARCGR